MGLQLVVAVKGAAGSAIVGVGGNVGGVLMWVEILVVGCGQVRSSLVLFPWLLLW